MLVKNIIKKSAEFLGLKNVQKYLNNEIEITDEISEELDTFLLAINLVNNNIASSYIELVGNVEISSDNNGKILYSEISNNPIIEIKNVSTKHGDNVGYKLFPDYIKLDYNNAVNIEYTYFPNEVTIEDEINYYLKLNELNFAVGVVGEYLYIKGIIDDASTWDKRFKQNMFNLIRPKRNLIMPTRGWD